LAIVGVVYLVKNRQQAVTPAPQQVVVQEEKPLSDKQILESLSAPQTENKEATPADAELLNSLSVPAEKTAQNAAPAAPTKADMDLLNSLSAPTK